MSLEMKYHRHSRIRLPAAVFAIAVIDLATTVETVVKSDRTQTLSGHLFRVQSQA